VRSSGSTGSPILVRRFVVILGALWGGWFIERVDGLDLDNWGY